MNQKRYFELLQYLEKNNVIICGKISVTFTDSFKEELIDNIRKEKTLDQAILVTLVRYCQPIEHEDLKESFVLIKSLLDAMAEHNGVKLDL